MANAVGQEFAAALAELENVIAAALGMSIWRPLVRQVNGAGLIPLTRRASAQEEKRRHEGEVKARSGRHLTAESKKNRMKSLTI
jgi:hypothetical protein